VRDGNVHKSIYCELAILDSHKAILTTIDKNPHTVPLPGNCFYWALFISCGWHSLHYHW